MIIIIKILQDIVIVIDALGQPFVVINRLGLIVASILGMESYGLMVFMKVGHVTIWGGYAMVPCMDMVINLPCSAASIVHRRNYSGVEDLCKISPTEVRL